ncbi:MAG: hypothetical protein ACI8SZ_000096, partial [Colwellia sp.]
KVFIGWRFTLAAHISRFCRNNSLDHIKGTFDISKIISH